MVSIFHFNPCFHYFLCFGLYNVCLINIYIFRTVPLYKLTDRHSLCLIWVLLFSYHKTYDVTKSSFLFFTNSCMYSFACVSNEILICAWSSYGRLKQQLSKYIFMLHLFFIYLYCYQKITSMILPQFSTVLSPSSQALYVFLTYHHYFAAIFLHYIVLPAFCQAALTTSLCGTYTDLLDHSAISSYRLLYNTRSLKFSVYRLLVFSKAAR